MNREKALIKNTIIISIGTICTKLITFLLLPLYTRVLTTEEYGIVDLLNTLSLLLIPIITFQMEQAIFRELIESRKSEKSKTEIISNGFFSILIQSFIFIVIFLLVSPFIKNNYKFFIVINVIFSIFASLLLQISRGLGDNKKYSIASFINALITVSSNVITLTIFHWKVNGMLLGLLLGQVATFVYLFFSLHLSQYLSFKCANIKITKRLWKYSLPLVPNALSWWIFGSSDRVIVSSFLGLSMNGILSAASKFSVAYTLLYSIFDRSWIESISLHIDDDDIEQYFNKTFNEILKMFFGIMILMISFMPIIYNVLINEKFNYGYRIVPFLMLGAFFNVVQGLVVVIYAAKKDTKSIAKTSMAAALLNIIIHFVLLKATGLYAAALSTLGAYFLISVYRFIDVKHKYMNIRINKSELITYIATSFLVIILYYMNNSILNIVSMLLSILIALAMNRKSAMTIFNLLKNKKGRE